ncbi:MAG: hypothetical protein IJ869_00775 [Clostridiales bacterium]|nr:hypothetical protein [Clostridiales bacterium]
MKLNGIFKDDMVFQSDKEIRVFGSADGERDIDISCVICDSDGKVISEGKTHRIEDGGSFLIKLPAVSAGGPYRLVVSSEERNEKICLERIYIGEVWIAGGQSNMEYPLIRSDRARDVIGALAKTNIHFYKVPVFGDLNEEQAASEAGSTWKVIDKDTCGDMSAVAFYFARKVLERLDREDLHIGIVGCYLGGTSVSSWQSTDTLKKVPEGIRYIDEFNEKIKGISEEDYIISKRKYDEECEAYNRRLEALLNEDPYISYIEADRILGPGAWPPPTGPLDERRPGALFNAMVLRITPFSSRGVIFYQGETDAEDHENDYSVVFANMIKEWREVFLDDKLPFVFCQLPMYSSSIPALKAEIETKWAILRSQQQIVADTVPYTSQVILTDCGEVDNIHPSEKRTPGERLAEAALISVYGIGN